MPLLPGAAPDNSSPDVPGEAGLRPVALLLALCLLVYLPGFFSIPPVDRDESRFAQASRQMFESVALPAAGQTPGFHDGGLVIPKIQDRPRLNKPPLIYWLQAASAAVLTGGDPMRDEIWMYRVPSLLAAISAVFLTWRLGSSMFGGRVGVLAGALLAVCPVVAWEAHQARADMVLLAFTTAAMAALWRLWSAPSRPPLPYALVFWLFLAAGVMTKGPITPLIAALAVLTLSIASRRWRWLLDLRPALGFLILAAAIAPWVYAVAERVGPDFYFRTILDETLGRAVKSREGHWAPPGYHLILLPVLLWPGSLLTAAGVGYSFRRAFPRRASTAEPAARSGSPPDLFLLAWIVPAWIVFELIGTKLPHYTLPLYPAIAILSARAVALAAASVLPIRHPGLVRWPWIIIGLFLCIGLPLGCWIVAVRDSAWIIALGLLWAIGLMYWLRPSLPVPATSDRWMSVQRAGLIAMAATALFLFQALLPATKRLWISSRIVHELLAPADPTSSRPLAALEYHEDSLIFLTRGRVERLDESGAGAWWRDHPDGLMILPTERLLRIHRPLGETFGYNYSRGGRRQRLSLVELFTHP